MITVIKIGGSLYDLPDLRNQLLQFLKEIPGQRLLVVGGGDLADCIRNLDRIHTVGEVPSHWLALRTLQITAYFIHELIPDSEVISNPNNCQRTSILDAYQFALEDDLRSDHLPRSWIVTSDSIALRAAQIANAQQLILLKSTTELRDDLVDPYFSVLMQRKTIALQIVNFRAKSHHS